ncbi:MAG: hypothetical protein LBN30_05430 [Oscillospiraceae bacterium]|nr:hypothetical protein [Oscillospiraceae bacterium]
MPVSANQYERATAAGVTSARARVLTNTLGALQPAAGAKSVSDLQRYRAAVDLGTTDKERLAMHNNAR